MRLLFGFSGWRRTGILRGGDVQCSLSGARRGRTDDVGPLRPHEAWSLSGRQLRQPRLSAGRQDAVRRLVFRQEDVQCACLLHHRQCARRGVSLFARLPWIP